MYEVTVRDHMMIAHSFHGSAFGPAQKLHGATYVVDASFFRPDLNADGVVVDIAAAAKLLGEVLAEFNLDNLDEHPDLVGHNTTTEFMARVVFDRLRAAIVAGRLGAEGHALARLRVRLAESHVASAGYESDL